MDLASQLRRCIADLESSLADHEIAVRLAASEGGASIVLDLDAARVMGRMTLWAHGLCDVEILEVETGRQVLWKHFDHIEEDCLA